MNGIKLAIVFSSLVFSTYADNPSNLICSKTYFPDEEGALPSSMDDDAYTNNDPVKKNAPRKNSDPKNTKKWTPEADGKDATGSSSLLVPKADKEFFPTDE